MPIADLGNTLERRFGGLRQSPRGFYKELTWGLQPPLPLTALLQASFHSSSRWSPITSIVFSRVWHHPHLGMGPWWLSPLFLAFGTETQQAGVSGVHPTAFPRVPLASPSCPSCWHSLGRLCQWHLAGTPRACLAHRSHLHGDNVIFISSCLFLRQNYL